MSDQPKDTTPLGRSVEAVERESGNLINDPREGETMRRENEQAVIPAVVSGNTSVIAATLPGALIEKGSGPDDGTADTSRGSSEE